MAQAEIAVLDYYTACSLGGTGLGRGTDKLGVIEFSNLHDAIAALEFDHPPLDQRRMADERRDKRIGGKNIDFIRGRGLRKISGIYQQCFFGKKEEFFFFLWDI